MLKYRKVAVLMGGVSSERDVSLRSGAAIAQGLREAGCSITEVVLDEPALPALPAGCEAVFIALHGGYGENGGVQADLDAIGMPYTGPGAAASAIAMDKVRTKKMFIEAGVPTAEFEVISEGCDKTSLPWPVAVKPPCDGSSVGVTCPVNADNWAQALETARKIDKTVLVERYIPGNEWTVGVVAGEALPVVQIAPKCGVYDYHSKYTAGETEYTTPDESQLTRMCQKVALAACDAIGVRGLGRVDFRVTPEGECYALEVNTVPGFTATSLVPKAARKAGMTFSELCVKILNLATHD